MFKPYYSPDEMKELQEWFQQHQDMLPKDMQLNQYTYIPDVKRTTKALLEALHGRQITNRLAGMATFLTEIKEKVESDAS